MRGQEQEQGEVALHLFLDVPRRDASEHADKAREQDEAEADSIKPEVILDVEVGDPGPPDHEVALSGAFFLGE